MDTPHDNLLSNLNSLQSPNAWPLPNAAKWTPNSSTSYDPTTSSLKFSNFVEPYPKSDSSSEHMIKLNHHLSYDSLSNSVLLRSAEESKQQATYGSLQATIT